MRWLQVVVTAPRPIVDMLLKTLSDILFPHLCFGCRRIGSVLCLNCLSSTYLNATPSCLICQKNSLSGFSHSSCLGFYHPERLITPFLYTETIEKIIKSAKFEPFAFSNLESLADLCLQRVLSLEFSDEFFIVPMPLHKRRLLERGFNQSEIIGLVLSRFYRVPILKDALVRVKDTQFQSTLSKKDRHENMEGAFALGKDSVKGVDVLLVDDVCTTGATFLSASRVLKLGGARFVYCFSLAKA